MQMNGKLYLYQCIRLITINLPEKSVLWLINMGFVFFVINIKELMYCIDVNINNNFESIKSFETSMKQLFLIKLLFELRAICSTTLFLDTAKSQTILNRNVIYYENIISLLPQNFRSTLI